ncbi:hypothetical protein D0Y53_01535 [Luteimonas weifangensis]|uniref:Uncharacterized protein n=1 Tax=Cognatiluteimonas weifangensis TaxID=2303539 RepID=A0A372DT27_9GAMM|nr:hypothetical protein D0Y53_01535 [Luteimonas weifangensis]
MLPAALAGDGGRGWVGKIVPPYPDGVVETAGSCIGDPAAAPAALCDHAIAVLHDPQSGLRTILALTQAPHFGKQPLWRIADALEPGELDDRGVEVATATCRLRGRDDAALVALVRPTERAWWAPLRAWRFDIAAGQLQPVAAADVRCRNEGFGYDG